MPYVHLEASSQMPALCVHYRRFSGPDGARPLVLLHELGGTVASWVPLAERLCKQYDVYAFDQRCAGRSEHTVQPFTLWDLAEDAIRFADAVGISGQFVLMGLAMGAVTATHVAVRNSDRLAALVLCDGTPNINEQSRKYLLNRAAAVRQGGMRVVAETSYRNAFKGLLDRGMDDRWGPYLERFTCNAPISYAMQSEALANFVLDDADFSHIAVPTLALTGEHDFIWPPEVGESLAARIFGSKYETVTDAAHFPPLQQPDAVAQQVLSFLEREDS